MVERKPVLVDGQPFIAGVVLVDKPPGVTSFGIVQKVRRLLGVKKVGHAGTLDPFASGLLIICAGRPATRIIDRFMDGRKSYRASIQLGAETETLDPEGMVTTTASVPELTEQEIDACLQSFVGPQLQAPPPFSAAKHKGKPLYYYARQGVMVQKEAKPIDIYSIDCIGYEQKSHRLHCEIVCSRGTYIRVLAADIGKRLGCGAFLQELRRTESSGFSVEEGLAGKALETEEGLKQLLARMMDVEYALSRCDKKKNTRISAGERRAAMANP